MRPVVGVAMTLALTACGGATPTTGPGTPAPSPQVHVLAMSIDPGPGRDAVLSFSAHNAGGEPDSLVDASCRCATRAELVVTGQIRPEETGLFGPNGDHVVLHGVDRGLAEGDTVDVTLTFDRAGAVTVPAEVVGD